MTTTQLLAIAQALAARAPDAQLIRSQVGNLSIIIDGKYAGWVDLHFGEYEFFEDAL